jgi:predicted TIM-barrel fold metal-dependent hydrolase
MILDGHVHIRDADGDPAALLDRMKAAGVDGASLISAAPACFARDAADPAGRLNDLLRWTEGAEHLFPLFWVDPFEDGAVEQVGMAAERGVAGFKIICDRFRAGDERPLDVFRAIAEAGKPVLCHAGILWDGKPSGPFCRPCNFEALIELDGLRFTLAHVAWPWIDECIAVYGKFLNARSNRSDLDVEMFIDLTPGTPPIYRRDALAKLFTVGYDIEHNVIFGTDCCANDYNVAWAQEWIARDNAIYEELGLSAETRRHIYAANLLRFLGASEEEVEHRDLRPAQS